MIAAYVHPTMHQSKGITFELAMLPTDAAPDSHTTKLRPSMRHCCGVRVPHSGCKECPLRLS